jgi:hypothetical protein
MRRPRTNFPLLVSKWLPGLTALAAGGDTVSAELTQAACIILLLHENKPVKEVAAQFSLSVNRVVTVRHRFMILGLPGLKAPAPLRFRRLTGCCAPSKP